MSSWRLSRDEALARNDIANLKAPPVESLSSQLHGISPLRLIFLISAANCRTVGYPDGVLGSRRGGGNKSRRLLGVVTRIDPRHDSPDGADGYAEDLGPFGLIAQVTWPCRQAGRVLRIINTHVAQWLPGTAFGSPKGT
jgi:hypothetical protein